MPLKLQRVHNDKILLIFAQGKLTKEDYQLFVPEVESLINQHGKIRILFDMQDFEGSSPGALWEDLKFDWKHFNDIERLAIVGDKKWEEAMAAFCKPFTTAEIRYFGSEEAYKAHDWIEEGRVSAEQTT